MDERTVRVGLGERAYDIVIGRGLIATAGERLRPLLPSPRVVVVGDETVLAAHGDALTGSLEAAGIASALLGVPAGEGSKSLAVFGDLMERLLVEKLDRKTSLIAFGGGVIGDLVGFAASALLRGVPFVQMPTTLLAQVDSSVGGKTGINAKAGKNLIGAFYQPRAVLADLGVLESLPQRELLAGYAEIAKYGLLGDEDFFHWLERHGHEVLAGNARRAEAIEHSCAMKARIVAADEHETGERALLNLGHTFGHAIEKEAGYDGRVLHGEAVAIGMAMAFALSVRLGLCDGEDSARAEAHLRHAGLPTRLAHLGLEAFDPARLAAHCRGDKKAEGGRLAFVLARRIGETFVSREADEADVAAIFEEYRR